jgi:hypothetical protein
VVDEAIPGNNLAVKDQVDFYLKKGDVAGAEAALDKGTKAWQNLGVDRKATDLARAERDAGQLPKGMTYVQRAQQIKEQLMQGGKPAWTPLDRQPVPSVNEIRARVQAEATAPKPGSAADTADDRAIQQEMNWNLERHGWSAESEARREFIARNSTGMTKGELTKQFQAQNVKPNAAVAGSAGPAAGSGSATAGPSSDELIDLMQKSLDQVRGRKKGK